MLSYILMFLVAVDCIVAHWLSLLSKRRCADQGRWTRGGRPWGAACGAQALAGHRGGLAVQMPATQLCACILGPKVLWLRQGDQVPSGGQ